MKNVDPRAHIEQLEKLKLQNICYKYDNNFQLCEINFTLYTGEITCVIGESGSGKSTLLRLIAGLENASKGRIILNYDHALKRAELNNISNIKDLSPKQIIFDKEYKINLPPEKRNIALIFQNLSLFPNKTILENVKFAIKDVSIADPLAMNMLKLVGMEKYANDPPQAVSGGQQQLVTLARAFAQEPNLLLLDEPFSSLDPILRAQIREKVIALIKKRHLTALIVTHDPQEALEIGDKIIILRNGKVIMCDTPHNIYYYPTDIRAARLFGEINYIPTNALPASSLKSSLINNEKTHLDSPWGEIKLPQQKASSPPSSLVYARPEAIKLAQNFNEPAAEVVEGIVEKVRPFSQMVNFHSQGHNYCMKWPLELSPKAGDSIKVKLDFKRLIFL